MRVLVAVLVLGIAASAPAARAAPPADAEPATCRHQSTASFTPRADDLVVGPLVLTGGRADTAPDLVARIGGQKYPLLVRTGHRVTVEAVGGTATLLYADRAKALPDGERTVADGDRRVTFTACPRGRGGGSTYGGRKVTFWSGFLLTDTPQCLTLRVWADGARTPRRVRVALGRPCR